MTEVNIVDGKRQHKTPETEARPGVGRSGSSSLPPVLAKPRTQSQQPDSKTNFNSKIPVSKSGTSVTLGVALNALNSHEKESMKRVEAIYQQHLEQLLEWKRHQITHIHTTFQQYRQSFFGESLPQPSWTPTPLILPNASTGTTSRGSNTNQTTKTPTIILTSKSGSVSMSEEESVQSRPPPLEADTVLQPMQTNVSQDNGRFNRRKRNFQRVSTDLDNTEMSDIVRAVKKRRLENSRRAMSVFSLSSDSESRSKSNSIGMDQTGEKSNRKLAISISSSSSSSSVANSPSRESISKSVDPKSKTKGVELLLAAADHFEAVRRSKSASIRVMGSNSVYTSRNSSRPRSPFSTSSRSSSVHQRSLPCLENVSNGRKRPTNSQSTSRTSVSPAGSVRSRSSREEACEKCSKVRGRMSKSNWGRHLAADHRHSCYLCPSSFTKKSYLTEHLGEIHRVLDSDDDDALVDYGLG